MPTQEELDQMTRAVTLYSEFEIIRQMEARQLIMRLALDAKRNDLLSQIAKIVTPGTNVIV